MAIPMSLRRRVVASSPNLLPKLLREGSFGLFLLVVHASLSPPVSYKQAWEAPSSQVPTTRDPAATRG
jgi:hypothetical protein